MSATSAIAVNAETTAKMRTADDAAKGPGMGACLKGSDQP